MLSVDKDSNLIPPNELERSVNAYKRTFNFYVRKFFLSAKNIVPRTGVEPVNPLRDTAF